jgi:hypothetical protein
VALNDEYHFRYRASRDHKSALIVKQLSPPGIGDSGLTQFVQVMPDVYKVPGDAVSAYRRFYIGEKSRFAKWTRRRPPRWFVAGADPPVSNSPS